MVLFQLIAGLIILVVGAEILVKGASEIAAILGITPLVIGLTVVAFGTSAPELAVSVVSALHGNPDIALGNVVGSNIFNILFVLGVSSMIVPMIVQQQLIRVDVPVMILASLLVLLFGIDGKISPVEGIILVVMGVVYLFLMVRLSRKEANVEVLEEYREEYSPGKKPVKGEIWFSGLLIIAGLISLVIGSRWLVDSSTEIARIFGVGDLVIGLTIIAAGTSLPEVATSVVAALRGERDIAVGNAVGSNIFNILFILGIAATIGTGLEISPRAYKFDVPVMIAVAVSCLPIFFTGRKLDRWEGILFLFYYFAYTTYLVLAAQENDTLEIFTKAMMWFTIPITVLTLGVVTFRELRKNNWRLGGDGKKGW